MDSFCWPKVVAVRALSTLIRVFPLVEISVMWGLNVIPLSKVVPRILVVGSTGIGEPFKVIIGWLSYSLLKGVMTVMEDFSADTFILFTCSQFSRSVR